MIAVATLVGILAQARARGRPAPRRVRADLRQIRREDRGADPLFAVNATDERREFHSAFATRAVVSESNWV